MSAWSESEALHERVRAMIRAYERRARSPESFDAIAADLARFQAANVPGYGRLCAAHGEDRISAWRNLKSAYGRCLSITK